MTKNINNQKQTELYLTRRNVVKLAMGTAGITTFGTIPASAETPLEDSLIFHHTLDSFSSDGTIPDATGNGVIGRPDDEYIDGSYLKFVEDDERGTVLQFDGNGTDSDGGSYNIHYSDLPDSLERGEPLTVSLWAKPRNLEGWQTLFHPSLGCGIDIRRGSIRARMWNDGRNEFNITGDVDTYLTPKEWNHLLATVAPGDEARLFVNGELVGTESVDSDQGYSTSHTAQGVGWQATDSDGAYDARYDGQLDDLRFYVGASASETVAQRVYEGTSSGSDGGSTGDSNILDDVSDGSIAEYFDYIGNYSVTSARSFIGDYAIRAVGGDNAFLADDGELGTVSQGSIFSMRVYLDSSAAEAGILFGVQTEGIKNWYNAEYKAPQNRLVIFRDNESRATETVANKEGVELPAEEWLQFKVRWDDGSLGGAKGDITFTITNESDEVLYEISGNNMFYTAGGIGYNNEDDVAYYDYYRKHSSKSDEGRFERYTDEDGYVDSEGLLDAGADYRNGEIDEDKLSEIASAFRSGEPLS